MEKYKRFTDAGTGINPFVPYIKKSGKNSSLLIVFNLLRMIVLSPLIFFVKLFLLTCFTVTYALMSTAFSLIPLWFIRRPIERYLSVLACRTALLVMGFFNIENSHANTNNRAQILSTSDQLFGTATHGDLIICNHISYIELLYLGFRYTPTFATVVQTDSKKDDDRIAVVRQGLLGALLSTINESRTRNVDETVAQKLEDVIKYAKENKVGPVVLFPEAATSNGRGILALQNSLFRPAVGKVLSEQKSKVHFIGFKLENTDFSPAYHHTSGIVSHLYGLMTQFSNAMTVKHVHLSGTETQQLLSEFYAITARTYLCNALKLQPLASSIKDKADFLEYWEKTQSRNYTEASE